MLFKLVRGGIAGAIAFAIANVVSNLLFFQIGKPILFDPDIQSEKFIAVLFELEPLPLMFTNSPLYMAIVTVIGIVHGLVFTYIEPSFPKSTIKRGVAFAVILWALMALYFEFHTPFNMFHEPVSLLLLELFFWVMVLLVEGILISLMYGASRSPSRRR
ncbi:hypothetical protein XM38_029620 [Halomicronema hongdechloris C2206]|uniref:Uncharacterized protein n=1 Tax=Halomicronema hongdechloris C2206 TaxID=1641165 RepID=A0A1Z3HNY4_9CYAN|nr:hypothetical protein [Halomicronema hongdechloris]ASC72008.1 hypothetical protein XM38_029620 [Halomicronema hongdechloris C2206]